MIPVKVFGQYVVGFEAEPEETSMRHHFVKECGWTPGQYRAIQKFDWFSTKVTLWKSGELLGAKYLGCCAYKAQNEFWAEYEGDYFADMVRTLAWSTGDATLIAQVEAWHESFKEIA